MDAVCERFSFATGGRDVLNMYELTLSQGRFSMGQHRAASKFSKKRETAWRFLLERVVGTVVAKRTPTQEG